MNYRWISTAACLLILALLLTSGQGNNFQNDSAAVPEVECSPEAIVVKLNTTSNLASKIFVRGHHDEANCSFEQTNEARFLLQDCGIVRERQLNPKGLAVTSTFVVQSHPFFITKLDRAYKVRCFYMEADHTMTSNLEVSTISPSPIDQETSLPQCTYNLRMEHPDGESVRYAHIGDRVWHIWECDAADSYGMLVHTCSVRDGKGNQIQIIDEKGCALDDFIMDTPKYNDSLSRAEQETLVFKFADVLAVQFHCQIRLCLKANGGCEGITPPVCENRTRQLELTHVKPEPIAVGEGGNATEGFAASSNASVSAGGDQAAEAAAGESQDAVMPTNDASKEASTGGDQPEGSGTGNEGEPSSGEPASNPAGDDAAAPGEGSAPDPTNDTRSRRNVYSEPWFTDAPYLDAPSGLEADVSQEILVLEVGDAASPPKDDEKLEVRLPNKEAQEQPAEPSRRVCLTSGALAAVISGFVFVIMLLSLAVFVMLIKRHQARVNMMGSYSTCRAYKF